MEDVKELLEVYNKIEKGLDRIQLQTREMINNYDKYTDSVNTCTRKILNAVHR